MKQEKYSLDWIKELGDNTFNKEINLYHAAAYKKFYEYSSNHMDKYLLIMRNEFGSSLDVLLYESKKNSINQNNKEWKEHWLYYVDLIEEYIDYKSEQIKIHRNNKINEILNEDTM